MLRTHRQRVPAMLAVACVGMMVYAVADAAPDDGRQLAPAEATAPAAKSGSDTPSTTGQGDKSSSPKDDCKEPTTSTTRDGKGGDGKDGAGKDGAGSTPTTTKDGKGDSGSTPTTTKAGKGDSGSTPTTSKGDSKDVSPKSVDGGDASTTAAVKNGSGSDAGSDKADSTSKGDSGSAGKDGCDPKTPTTDKGGKDSTTDTTRKGGGKTGGKGSTTTTTDRKDRSTTSTTEKKHDTVEPTTPSGGADPGSGGTDSGGSSDDPAATPIEPQEAPPEASASDPGQGGDPEATADDPGAVDGGYYDMPDEGPVAWDEDEVAIEPMAAPGEAEPVIPSFGGGFYDGSGWKAPAPASRPSRSSGNVQQFAAPPLVMSSSGSVQASPGVTESDAVSRRLGGMQTSVTESAFPADIISTPKVFPMNRRDPLAAAALILLIGVARELFKAWRRQASDYWPV